ncbi:transposase [Limosilactobacillus reuteri]|uniref:transposase n=1 Tax=Limosilactobacillus reuteri TaxID=1598 RepID=UPI001E3AD069|nr:transposase [Limosilactobacillus reuteri]MCC4342287.1 transposase [Limosilactobacillus reuteri]
MVISKPNIMGRPREYDPRMLLKLVLLAYSYGIVSCRKIEKFARENIVAMWLTQEQRPTYRTIARFIVSKELIEMIRASFKDFHDYLQKAGLIDEASFIDGIKILANANKYSFIWKKRTIKYSDLNVVKARKSLSSSNAYSRRKYDVETVFGNLKAYLGFTRFTVRGLKKVKKQIGIALMALNMKKLAGRSSNFLGKKSKKKDPFGNLSISEWIFLIKGLMSQSLFCVLDRLVMVKR